MSAIATLSTASAPVALSNNEIMLNGQIFDRLTAVARVMSSGTCTVPKHLQGKEGDCFAIAMQAMQWGMNPFVVGQKTHLVNGILGYEAQLVIAVINANAPIVGRLNFEWFGPWDKVKSKDDASEAGVICRATIIGESEPRELAITMARVGNVRNSPLWANDPRQQIAYLAAKRWARLHCPDVILGVYTPDELAESAPRDMGRAERVQTAMTILESAPPTESIESIIADMQSATSLEALDEIVKRGHQFEKGTAERREIVSMYRAIKANFVPAEPEPAQQPAPTAHSDFYAGMDAEAAKHRE